jgi:hypothetical protein
MVHLPMADVLMFVFSATTRRLTKRRARWGVRCSDQFAWRIENSRHAGITRAGEYPLEGTWP